jgi:membrane fusion protein (multidrug efflux system)
MFPRHPFVVPVCLLLFGLSACHKAPDEKGKASAAALVTTQVLAPSTWSDTLQALGTVKAHESVTLTAKLSEIVEAVHFESGQQVAAGQVLVTLRGNAQQAALRRRRPNSATPMRCTCASANLPKSS